MNTPTTSHSFTILVQNQTGFIFSICHADATYDADTNTLIDYIMDAEGNKTPQTRQEYNVSLHLVDSLPADFMFGDYIFEDNIFKLSEYAFMARYNMTRQQGTILKEMIDVLETEEGSNNNA